MREVNPVGLNGGAGSDPIFYAITNLVALPVIGLVFKVVPILFYPSTHLKAETEDKF